MKLRLSDIKVGTAVRITAIEEAFLKAKLMEMGLLCGKEISIEFKAPLGDPIAVDVDGSLIALRLDEAKYITVEPSLN